MLLESPSQVTDRPWLFAERKIGEYPEPFPMLSGKWLIFIDKSEIDEFWGTIRRAVEDGKLGASAKVSTAMPSLNASDSDNSVIVVYTYNHEDEEDVMRIREGLRKLGVTWKIPYKTDMATIQGKYAVKGDKRISKYYC